MVITRNSGTKSNCQRRPPKNADTKNIGEKKSKSKSTKKGSGKTRLIHKYLDEEWQRDMLPLILEQYPSPPNDMVTFKALIESSNLQAISKSIIESLLSDEIINHIPHLLSDIFEDLIDYKWNELWKNLYNISTSEYQKRLSNEQIYWSWASEKIVFFFFLSGGRKRLEVPAFYRKCTELKEHQLDLKAVDDLLAYSLSFSSDLEVNVFSFIRMFEEIDPPVVIV